jgi:release factor glutamine methyltransferase
MPTLKALLAHGRSKLVDTETPSLDARLLLQHACGVTHADVIADAERSVSDDMAQQYEVLLSRRAAFEPVSRILGTREFFGRNFRVTPHVLDPRADTEVLVDVCLKLLDESLATRVLDLGTGSGCIAITVLAERPLAHAVAVDVSADALAVAHDNAMANGVGDRLTLVQGQWFSPVQGGFDVIASNPPYIETATIAGLDVEVRAHDPHMALDGGADGLDCYRAIAAGAALHVNVGGHVVVEIGAGQAQDVATIFQHAGYALAGQHMDLGGHVRVLDFRAGL